MKNKSKAQAQTQKTFSWGISSTSISFTQASDKEAARDGSANDCGCVVSPTPQPLDAAKKPQRRAAGKA